MSTTPSPPPDSAEAITAASQSNLALAFVALSEERRRDISVFYAFCRLVDDLVDEETPSLPERQAGLAQWERCLTAAEDGEPPLAPALRDIIARYHLDLEHFREILRGCEMDMGDVHYPTWESLRLYCYRVASAVGLISIEIFGYTDERCRLYARDLGLALQLTNIVRDVDEDYRERRRIYLPEEDMARFGYTKEDVAASRWTPQFQALAQFQAERAEALYRSAAEHLPKIDRKNMIAAEIMRRVYYRLLQRMKRSGFRVFGKRCALGRWEKAWIVLSTILRSRFW